MAKLPEYAEVSGEEKAPGWGEDPARTLRPSKDLEKYCSPEGQRTV